MKRFWILLWTLALLGTALIINASAEGAVVSGIVWLDKDGDGMIADESGLQGAIITLEKKTADGGVQDVAIAECDPDGAYQIAIPGPGEYRVAFTPPAGYRFTRHGGDSAALPTAERTAVTPFFTVSGNDRVQKNAGLSKITSYYNLVSFIDANVNGGRMSTESPVPGLVFSILYDYDGQTYEVASGKTNINGECTIRDLPYGGPFYVRAELPENMTAGPMGQKITAFHNCFKPGEGNTAVSIPFEFPYKGSVGMGLGIVRTGGLTGKILYMGTGSVGAPQVQLLSENMQTPLETPVDAQGEYRFSGLQPGGYDLVFRLPDGCLFADDPASLLRGTEKEGRLQVTVQEGTTTPVGSVLYTRGTSASLRLMEDKDLSVTADEGESPIAGAKVKLTQKGKALGSGKTDENGIAFFPTVRQGSAVFSVELPQGFLFTDDAKTKRELEITAGDEPASVVLCAARASALTGMLFDDPTNTGVFSDRCTPLPGFTVQAIDAEGNVAAEAKTDKNGQYRLEGLLPVSYKVRFILGDNRIAAPYAESGDAAVNHIAIQTPEYGETNAVTLPYDGVLEHVDGAFFKAGIVSGYVYSNANHDGLTTSEGGAAGVTATLIDENGQPVSDFSYGVSDQNGYFCIKGVLPGRYAVSYSVPQDCVFNCPMTDERTVRTTYFEMDGGREQTLPPVGVVYTASVSGRGLRFSDGSAIPGIGITLACEALGYSETTVTDENGAYSLSMLRPETYTMTVTLPDGYVFAESEDSFLPGKAASTIRVGLALRQGKRTETADILADLPAAVQGRLYYDRDMDSVPDENDINALGRDVKLTLGKNVIALTTDENGVFSAEQLIPGVYGIEVPIKSNEFLLPCALDETDWKVRVTAETPFIEIPMMAYGSISGQIWNLDGKDWEQEAVTVSLYNEAHECLSTVKTSVNGRFSFTKLLPGVYTLEAELPDGYLFARVQDTALRPSHIQTGAAQSVSHLPITVDVGSILSGIDIGVGANGAVGDLAWLDENGNGMQDIGESPLPGIRIEMYQYGEFVASAQTDGSGHYLMENLYPGEYEMRVTMPEEVKPTIRQTDFPLVASILPETEEKTVSVTVTVPSGGENLHMDLGFTLVKKGVYPASMEQITVKDWTPYAER